MESPTLIYIIQYAAIGILFVLLIYSLIQNTSEMQPHVIILLVSTILMFVGYSIEIKSNSLETALIGAYISYLGKPFIMVESFMLITILYGKNIKKSVYFIIFIICSFFPVILFSNGYHHLYYKTTVFDAEQIFSPLIITRGPLYISYIILSISFFSSCFYIIISEYFKGKGKNTSKRRKLITLYSSLMIIFGMGGYAVFLFNVTNNYDSTMFGVFLGVICLMLMVFRCKILDTVTLAKEYALSDSSVGLLVYNDIDSLIYCNDTSKKLIKNPKISDFINSMTSNIGEIKVNKKIYSITKKEFSTNNSYIGKYIEIKDITLSRNYQETLETEVKERTEKIKNLQKTIIQSIAEMIEARSIETGDHTKRTAKYATEIARALKSNSNYKEIIDEQYIDALKLAVPLHDIGKITISDTILLKPGKLTDEEFEIMKHHAENGSILIEKTMSELESEKFLKMAEDIAKYHHERWDGTGYPDGIKGEDIPLSARIAAIADCFDALSNERCYKPAYSFDESLQIIREESGTHFDPEIVKEFLHVMQN